MLLKLRESLIQVNDHQNFDGNLMAIGTMSGPSIDRIIQALTSFGLAGRNKGDKSGIILSHMFGGT